MISHPHHKKAFYGPVLSEEWYNGMINAIYTSGPKYDPSNYRGIILTSCLGQLFSTPLHVRFENEAERKKYSPSPKQAPKKTIERQSI